MPRVQIPVTTIAETGTARPAATAGDAANDHYIDGTVDLIVECTNTSAGSLDVTFVTSYVTAGGLALADNVISVGAGATKLVKLDGNGVRLFYKQSGDADRIYIDVTSNSWEFRAYAL